MQMNEELKVIIKAEIAQFKKGLEEAKKSMGSFKDEVKKYAKDANSTIKKMGDGVAKVGKTIGKAITAGAAAAGAGVVALGKKALDCYGNYEQLVGGIQTLFKDSAGTVEQYAKDAYKNQQMSANQYMDIATSFSASLLQGLGGDTAEAAKITDMAITDMADNANKMGSSMESIQNAYQGFAKQNYTMLDNLKLGYGGTKEEMERLLADAEKLTGVHYDISNLGDVYSAIHAIQEEMGITGTSAKEAATTIEGTIAMMKAAWQNWLTGLMDNDADINQLTQDLIDSVSQVIDNIAPRIGEFFDSLVESIHNALADHPEAQAIFDDIVSAIQTVNDIVSDVVNFVIENWGTVEPILTAVAVAVGVVTAAVIAYNAVAAIKAAMDAAQVVSLGALIAAQLASAAATLVALAPYILIVAAIAAVIAVIVLCVKHWDEIKEKVVEVWDKMVSTIESAVEAVKEWFGNLKQGIADKVNSIREAISEKFNAIKQKMSDTIQAAKDKVIEHFTRIKDGIREKIQAAKETVSNVVDNIKEKFSNGFNAAKETVVNIFDNIKQGIKDKLEAAKQTVKNVIDKIKGFFNFEWHLPKLKMPHISISGEFSLMPPKVPKFSIDWYAKGGVFDAPTLFNNGGRLSGLGEAGAEAIVPLENNTQWLDKISDRLSSKMGGNRPIIMQVDGKTFAEISVDSINALTRQRGSLALNLV
jgi:phage-related protein